MPNKALRFAIFGNDYQPKKSESAARLLSSLSARGAQVSIENNFRMFLTEVTGVDCSATQSFEGSDFEADFVISMGGDGTLLKAESYVGSKQIPIIGVNTGRLGFLAQTMPSEIDQMLDDIWRDNYAIDEHAMIMAETDGLPLSTCPYALNDIAVLKRDNASMISIRAEVNGEHLVTYQADGLIISTPTGSTAYSLSNGGPIIVPRSGIICLTPVAPHSLNVRPIVISDDSEVTLTVESRSHNFLAAIDGRSEKVLEGTVLTVRKAPFVTRILRQHNKRFFSTLREKMMWGVDKR